MFISISNYKRLWEGGDNLKKKKLLEALFLCKLANEDSFLAIQTILS